MESSSQEDAPKTLEELFNRILPIALRAGISIFDFWDYTLGELTLILNNYKEVEEARAKETITVSYNQAVMIAQFVGLQMNGKKIPSMEELFPTMRAEKQAAQSEEIEYKKAMLLKEQFMFYANAHNKQRRLKNGGDGL